MATTNNTLLEVTGLKTYFSLRQGIVRAVDGADLSIERGKTLGLVGESGCGKSVTAQSILRIVPPPGKIVAGKIILHRLASKATSFSLTEIVDLTQFDPQGPEIREIRGREISMIFQEPMTSLSPVYTIGSQIIEAVLLHQEVSKADAKEMVVDMLERVGFSNPSRQYYAYPHELSGGMRQRAVIAMALMCRPSLLIADEPTTALDVTTEAQILRLMRELQDELGMAIMFITHDLGVIAKMAGKVAVMYLGRVVESADVDSIFHDPKHPYLSALLHSIPRLGRTRGKRLEPIKGMVPDPFRVPSGCAFHPRCPNFMPGVCDVEVPPSIYVDSSGHSVACHLYAADWQGPKGGES